MSFGQMRRYYGYRQAADVWGKTAEVYNPRTQSPQWSMLVGVLCCGDGNLIIVEGIMKKDGYVKILKEKESAAKLYVSAASSNRTTTQNTLLLVKDFPLKTKVNITDWPNVNATENLGAELKSITSGEAWEICQRRTGWICSGDVWEIKQQQTTKGCVKKLSSLSSPMYTRTLNSVHYCVYNHSFYNNPEYFLKTTTIHPHSLKEVFFTIRS